MVTAACRMSCGACDELVWGNGQLALINQSIYSWPLALKQGSQQVGSWVMPHSFNLISLTVVQNCHKHLLHLEKNYKTYPFCGTNLVGKPRNQTRFPGASNPRLKTYCRPVDHYPPTLLPSNPLTPSDRPANLQTLSISKHVTPLPSSPLTL